MTPEQLRKDIALAAVDAAQAQAGFDKAQDDARRWCEKLADAEARMRVLRFMAQLGEP